MNIWAACDNGVSGNFSVLDQDGNLLEHFLTPTFKCLNYTKKKKWMRRVDIVELKVKLEKWLKGNEYHFVLERPFVNPKMFSSTISAVRALEATQIVLEMLKIPYEFCDSKEWQKAMLPSGLKKGETKEASDQVVKRLFPKIQLKNPGDGDSILMACYFRKLNLGLLK